MLGGLVKVLALLLCLLIGIAVGGTVIFAAEKGPIVIGASISVTGAYSRLGEELRRGYGLWQKDVNARGGLLGRPVELKTYDDQSDPTTGAKLYEKLITQDKVDLIIGPFTSAVGFAASTVTEKYEYPMVAAGSSARGLWQRGFKYLFQIYPMPEGQLIGLIDIAKKNGIKTVAVLAEDMIYSKEQAAVAMQLWKDAGLSVVFYEEYGKGPADLSPVLLKVRARKPDMLFVSCVLSESILITRQSKELDINPKLFVFSIGPNFPDYVQSLGKDAEFAAGLTEWEATVKIPGVREFADRFQKAYGQPPAYQAVGGYVGLQVLEAAVSKVGSLDRKKIRDALATIEVQTMWGPYRVDEKGQQTAKVGYIIQIQNGKKEIVWPEKGATANLIFPTPEWGKRR